MGTGQAGDPPPYLLLWAALRRRTILVARMSSRERQAGPRPALLALAVALATGCGDTGPDGGPEAPTPDPEAARAAAERGMELLRRNNEERDHRLVLAAIEAFEEAARHDPADAAHPFRAGQSCRLMQMGEEARAHFDRVLELEPDHGPTLLRVAEDDYEGGDLESARGGFERALQRGAAPHEAWLGLGQVHEDRGELKEAAGCYQRSIAARGRSSAGHFRLAGVLELLGETEAAARARDEFERWRAAEDELELARLAARRTPDDPAAHVRVARAAFELADDAGAVRAMTRAVAGAPRDTVLAMERASLLHTLGQLPQALAAFEGVIGLDAGHVEARLGRAQILVQLGRTAEARDEYRNLLELAPQDPRAARSLEALGGGP